MRCKGCDAEISEIRRTKKRLNPDDMGENFQEEEDLCNTCLGVARDSYLHYNEDAYEVRDEDIRKWFYRPTDQLDSGVFEQINTEGCIGTEET